MNFFKMNLTTAIIVCTIIAGIFALTTAILQIIKQMDDAKASIRTAQESEKKQLEITDLQHKLLAHSDDIAKSQQEVIDLQKKLNEKNEKIENLQNTTLDFVTGGKSVPQIEFIVAGGSALFGIIHNSTDNPIRNVNVDVVRVVKDLYPKVKDGEISISKDQEATKIWNYKIGDLSQKYHKEFMSEQYSQRYDNILYIYSVTWLNGSYKGNFTIVNGKADDFQVINNNLSDHSNGIDISKTVYVNNKLAHVLP